MGYTHCSKFFESTFILQNETHNRDKTKDSTYNITDTKEKKKIQIKFKLKLRAAT